MKENKQAILIVDDRPANLLALEQTLSTTGAEIVRAGSGQEALAATLDKDFALAILDVQMPGIDGYELAELLRGNPETRSVPIVFVTAASLEEWQIFKGYESGAVDYIVKPYRDEIVISKVRVFLAMHAQKRALERQQEQLAALNKELEAFAHSVSHDLKAPLRAINGFSQALLESSAKALDEQSKDFLNRISSEACRMTRLIDDLLQLSRVTRVNMRWQRVDLTALARDLMTRLCGEAPQRVAEIVIADDLVDVGDPGLLRQVLENLLSNAWKFTAKIEQTRIEVGSTMAGGEETFFVRDNGVGFDMKYVGKLFAPFQRLHSMNDYPGTGIGLSTVQRIVARHGGRVWCTSDPGAGTTFYFTLGHGEVE